MKTYHVSVTGDRYPTSYIVEASSWSTAAARAVRQWQKRFKGSRTQEIKVHLIKGAEHLREDNH